VRSELAGEAVLTVGCPVHEWREGHIDAVVSVGPLECMPNKVSEAQFFHIAEREGLFNLTLSLNGDLVDPEIIDNFAYEVHARFRKKLKRHPARPHSSIRRRRLSEKNYWNLLPGDSTMALLRRRRGVKNNF